MPSQIRFLGLFEEEQLGEKALEICLRVYGKDLDGTLKAAADLALRMSSKANGSWWKILERQFVAVEVPPLNSTVPKDVARGSVPSQLSSYRDLWQAPLSSAGIDHF